MRYFIDCEFDGLGGALLSMALVREDGESLHFILPEHLPLVQDEWVKANVVPRMHLCGQPPLKLPWQVVPSAIMDFLAGDPSPHIVADWPDDLRYFCQCIIVGPGLMIDIPALTMEVKRIDAWPCSIDGLTQHNAWCDAVALAHKVSELEDLASNPLLSMSDLRVRTPDQYADAAFGRPHGARD